MKNTFHIIFRVLQVLGLFGITVFCFLGLDYIRDDELSSGAYAIIIFLILGVSASVLIYQKSKEFNMGFSSIEGLGLIFYCMGLVASFILVLHFFNVKFILEPNIKSTIIKKKIHHDEMIKNYEETIEKVMKEIDRNATLCINRFPESIDPNAIRLNNRCMKKFNRSVSNQVDAKNLVKRIITTDKTMALAGLDEIKNGTEIFIQNLEYSYGYITKFDTYSENNLNTLKLQFAGAGMRKDYWSIKEFSFELLPKENDINMVSKPFKLIKVYKPNLLLPLILGLIMHALVLIPYFSISRSRRIYKKGDFNVGQPL